MRIAAALIGALMLTALDASAAEPAPPCSTVDVEYALSGTLRLSETPMGKGDGAYKIGPGTTVLRFQDGRVIMRSYTIKQAFTVVAKAFMSTMTVTTDASTRATPNACGVAAEGLFKDGKVIWTTKVRGLVTEGTIACTGKFCGTNGAPPSGTTAMRLGPVDATFRPFEMSKDGKSFIMPFTFAAKTEKPKQTSYVAITGHEVKRTCVPPPKPCAP
jgi:hypothetical protein